MTKPKPKPKPKIKALAKAQTNVINLPASGINKRKLLDQIQKNPNWLPKVKVGKIHPLPTLEWGLQEIKKRYYHEIVSGFPGIATVYHLLDCAIHRSLEQYEFCFCSCGLLRDLEKYLSDDGLIEVIYPRYWHDYYLQERGEDSDEETSEVKASKEKEKEECQRTLYEIFGPPACTSLNEIKRTHEENKKTILKVFGKQFTDALFCLDQRLLKEVEDYRKHEKRYKTSGSSS